MSYTQNNILEGVSIIVCFTSSRIPHKSQPECVFLYIKILYKYFNISKILGTFVF